MGIEQVAGKAGALSVAVGVLCSLVDLRKGGGDVV